jgi:RNA polymerase sigma factor (sigma-70 family)
MPTSHTSEFLAHLRRAVLLREGAGRSDGQLLEDYLSRRDEAALAVLVHRHAPMVWGVVRRVLGNHHDAEDAFQATFLVFVRKAASIASRELLANWLYGVAYQTGRKARATASRRKGRERQVTPMPEPAAAEPDPWPDLQPILDEELSRLPDRYRAVLVLCDLEGKTRKEAAQQLGCPEGTVAGRLARARGLLAKRLARRGVVLCGAALAAMLAPSAVSAGVPPSVVSSTVKAVAGDVIPARVAALVDGVLKTMLLAKNKITAALVLLVAALLGGAVLIYQAQATEPPAKDVPLAAKKAPVKAEPKQLTKEEKLRLMIDRVLTAHGGEERLRNLQFAIKVQVNNGYIDQYFVQPPKNFRWEETHRDRGPTKRICILRPEGRMWWHENPGAAPVPFWMTGLEPPVEYWYEYVKFFGPRQVLRLKDADYRVTPVDDTVIDGRVAVGLKVTGRGFDGVMYFDRETHLLVKVGDTCYRDYQAFDGIPVARKMKRPYDVGTFWEEELLEFRTVANFDPKFFERP